MADNYGTPAKLYTLDGETKTLREWAAHYNIKLDIVKDRVKKGWELERALTTVPRITVFRPSKRKANAASQLKNNFTNLILESLAGLKSDEQIKLVQDKWKEDPLKFTEKVILPLIFREQPKTVKPPTGPSGNTQFNVAFNGETIRPPAIGGE